MPAPAPAVAPERFAGRAISIVSWDGLGANLPMLQWAAAGGGHFNPLVEPDGVYRRMTVGDIVSPLRKAYTVMGDAVQSGLPSGRADQGVWRRYPRRRNDRDRVSDVTFREFDRVKVKGKDAPVAIYEPLGLTAESPAANFEELKLWQHALPLYRARNWVQAGLQIYNLQQRAPGCRLYSRYAEHIATLQANPPDALWNGITTYQTK